MSTFHDELAALCSRQALLALASDDSRGPYADMIVELASALGRTIVFAVDGDATNLNNILPKVTATVAKEAATTAALFNLARGKTEGRA